jgi:predicted DsbA family dithiol-disulfide isomerase
MLTAVRKNYRIGCCQNASLDKCLRDTRHCSIAERLGQFGCWLIGYGKDYTFIIDKLNERYISLVSQKKYHINLPMFEPAGDTTAPVAIAVYISIGCPWCKIVCNFLHDTVTAGSLKGKAKVYVKLLSARPMNMALLAANESGKFWEYMKELETIDRRLDKELLVKVARNVGIAVWEFEAAMDKEKFHKLAFESRSEGLKNEVKATPTLFINGRRYYSYKRPEWIVDAVEYEYEQAASGAHKKNL